MPSGGHWFAIWIRSRHEQAVRQQLEEKRIEIFQPCVPFDDGLRQTVQWYRDNAGWTERVRSG